MSYRSYEGKYHGLINQGATCYLNSVLQVLFMTKDFKKAVQSDACGNHIDVQLASLFKRLKTQTAETVEVTEKLGIHKVCEQRDAAEHFEKILTLTSDEAAEVFRGKLTHKTTCSDCRIKTDEDAAFWDLPLALVNPHGEEYSVEDGIREFFRDSDFSGENQMYCDECRTKCDATATCVIKHHPEVLMLLLKRFEFSYQQMSFVKNSCAVDVPSTLKIPENQMYELYAFVEHFGNLKSGHYTATIKDDEEDRWYCFNDSSVTSLNNQPFRRQKTEKTRTAYLLFYKKKHTGIQDTNKNYEQRRDSNKSAGEENAVKSKGSHKKPSSFDARKQGKDKRKKDEDDDEGMGGKAEANDQTERNKHEAFVPKKKKMEGHEEIQEKKEKTEADRFQSRTDKQLEKHDSLKREKDEKHVSVKQDLPNKHEQQGDRKTNVQKNNEQMTGVNKHPLRDGAHGKQNRPNQTQDDDREDKTNRRRTTHDKQPERQKQNEAKKRDDDEESMGGKAEGIDQAKRKKDEMSPEKKRKIKVKTDNDRKTGQREEGHEAKIKDTKEKTEAGRKEAKTEKHLVR
ncbi:ubiquitin carboxyl-terminal hydrolase 17-like protein B isoform X3 [Melanotaenia boesemani]|uniref:ubiquitin carboxyl-terminal hydrolase 17-like protein B isoform X3 n=1 Tax=Melanotaenia boesemani TaxID=1250792 RepID=UPI001C04784E|nr:ubiquitin carboxyl-terminal hydrolase 17-like protein B isoform X3 [Melanotaenia boesemani]